MKIVKFFFAVLFAGFATVANSAEDRMYFPSADACISAVKQGTALSYTPARNTPLSESSGWKKTSSKGECIFTDSAQGKQWVYAAEGLPFGEKAGQVKMWKCSNVVYERRQITFIKAEVPSASIEAVASTGLDISKIQTIGGVRCNLYSDGTAKLKTSGRIIPKGEKITESVLQADLPNGQSCQGWREEFFRKYVDNPTRVVQM